MEQQQVRGASQLPLRRSSSSGSVVKLFVATALLLGSTAGCSNSKDCIDQNRDGYCDNGSGSSGGSSGYYGSSGGSGKSGTSSGISSGTHGGIGSSGSSGS